MIPAALASYIDGLPARGSFSIWAGPIDGPAAVEHDAERLHYAASTMKLPLVIAAYRLSDAAALDLDSRVRVHHDFASAIGGTRFEMDRSEDSDQQTWARLGTDVALRWLANRSIVRSGNLASNLVLEAVGLAAVADTLDAVDAKRSVVARGIEDSPARDAGKQNLVTATDLARTLQELVSRRVASRRSCDEILATLKAQQINDAIPTGLPATTPVAHKSGWVTGISHDAAIVYPSDSPPYVLVVCTTSELTEDASLGLIAGAAAASWHDRRKLA